MRTVFLNHRKRRQPQHSWWVSLFWGHDQIGYRQMLPRIQYLTVSCTYLYVSPLPKNTHIIEGAPSKSCCLCTARSCFLLLATFASHYDRVPRLQVCTFSATICGQRKVAAGEEIDGVGMVMDTGSLAQLRAPVHLALVTISYHCLARCFPGRAFDWTGGEVRIWHRVGFTSAITISRRRGRWLFVLCIVEEDCLMEVHWALCSVSAKGFAVCKRASESHFSVWLINSVSSPGCPHNCPQYVCVQYESVSLY